MENVNQDYLMEKGKEILYLCYKNDVSFPRSCGVTSAYISFYLFKNEAFRNKYKINLVRGHFRNTNQEDDCPFFDLESGDFSECANCTCDYFTQHSWVEIKDNEDMKLTILDFTISQFSEDIGDLEEYLHDNKSLSAEELITLLKKYGKFIVENNNQVYFPETITPALEVYNKISKVIEEEGISELEYWEDKSSFACV